MDASSAASNEIVACIELVRDMPYPFLIGYLEWWGVIRDEFEFDVVKTY